MSIFLFCRMHDNVVSHLSELNKDIINIADLHSVEDNTYLWQVMIKKYKTNIIYFEYFLLFQ